MRKFSSIVFIAAWLIVASVSFSKAQFEYISPLPDSKFHDPKTSIILRNGNLLDESSLKTKHLFTIEGSVSGRHDYDVNLSEKGKTIVLMPVRQFADGETVTVNVAEGIQSLSKKQIHGTSFSFEIRKARTPEENIRIAAQMRTLYYEEFSDNSTRDQKQEGAGFPGFTIDTNVNPAPGSVFWGNFNYFTGLEAHYCIITSNGDSVFGKYDTTVYNNFDLNKNGYLTVYHDEDSAFVMLDSNYNQIAEYQMGNGYKADVHEFLIYSNGNRYMLAYDPQIVDMTVYDPTYSPNATVIGCILQELDNNNNVIFQWRSWDHYSILDAEHISFANSLIDYCHANTIDVGADGNILFSARNMSEVTKINRSTGDIIWRWGGLNNQFTFIGDDDKFSYQHDVQRIANGHIIMFDNGNYHATPRSYAKEYILDEVNKTATLIWSYSRSIPGGNVYSKAMGSVQRLPNGNTFICWGLVQNQEGAPKLTEVDSLSNIVWELSLDVANATYRAHRYLWDPCARPTASEIFTNKITTTSARVNWQSATNAETYEIAYRKLGKSKWKIKGTTGSFKNIKNLTPGKTYEFRIQSHCSIVATTTSGYTDIMTFTTAPLKEMLTEEIATSCSVYPNPVNNQLQIDLTLDKAQAVSVSFYDLMGKMVLHSEFNGNAGELSFQFDVSRLTAGIYMAEIKTDKGRIVQKFVKE